MIEIKTLVKINVPAVIAQIVLESDKNVRAAAFLYWRSCQEILSKSAGGASKTALSWRRSRNRVTSKVVKREIRKAIKAGHSIGSARRQASLVYEKFRHSKPGEPPRLITGFLRNNVVVRRVDRSLYRVGLFRNAMYGFYLDQGTSRIAPRPWILPALRNALPRITNVITTIGVR